LSFPAISALEKNGTNGKTDGTDLQIKTDFFYEKARVSRKKIPKNPFQSVNPFHPFYHVSRFFPNRQLLEII
jgi:hypothetical protein